jgi:hypothetical protein
MKGYALRTLALVILVVTTAAASYAGSADRITLHIPFQFTAGARTLPAGVYGIRPMSSTRVALVRIDKGHRDSTMLSTIAISADVMPTRAKLVFHRYGRQYFLVQVWTPERNLGHELPASAAEQALKKQLEQSNNPLATNGAEPQVVTLVAGR